MSRVVVAGVLCFSLAACGPYADVPDAGDGDGSDAGTPPGTDSGTPDAGFVDPGPPDGMASIPNTVAKAKADCSNGRRVYVHSAVDGDTLQLSNYVDGHRERVRMVGVNTPEKYETPPECFSSQASAYTAGVLQGRWICLTYDPAVTEESNNVDAFGRTLGYVFFGENYARFHNAELVYRGYARDFAFTDGAVYERYFRDLERNAYDADRGLWGACP